MEVCPPCTETGRHTNRSPLIHVQLDTLMFRSASYEAGHRPWHRRLILPNTLTRTILVCICTLDWFLFGHFRVKYMPIIWHRITLKVRQQLLKLAWQFWCSNLIAGLYLIAFNFRPTFKKIEKKNLICCCATRQTILTVLVMCQFLPSYNHSGLQDYYS